MFLPLLDNPANVPQLGIPTVPTDFTSFLDRNGVNASISTAGGVDGGTIVIRHGGGGVTPFLTERLEVAATQTLVRRRSFSEDGLSHKGGSQAGFCINGQKCTKLIYIFYPQKNIVYI